MTKQLGLSAANFLLLAGGHLMRAKEKLAKEQGPDSRTMPYLLVDDACDDVRDALKMLSEKEKPCNKP